MAEELRDSPPDEANSDFKLLKQFARKCSHQNKLLQRMLAAVVEELNKDEPTVKGSLEDVDEELVELFLDKWAGHIGRLSYVENNAPSAINNLEMKCALYENKIEHLQQQIEELEFDALNVSAVEDRADRMPVSRVRLHAGDGLVGTSTITEGGISECISMEINPSGSVMEPSLIENVMAACLEHTSVTAPVTPPAPAVDYAQPPASTNSGNPFDCDDDCVAPVSVVRTPSGAHETVASSSSFATASSSVVAKMKKGVSDSKLASTSAVNPFDESDESALSDNAEATAGLPGGSVDSEDDEESNESRKADPFVLTEVSSSPRCLNVIFYLISEY